MEPLADGKFREVKSLTLMTRADLLFIKLRTKFYPNTRIPLHRRLLVHSTSQHHTVKYEEAFQTDVEPRSTIQLDHAVSGERPNRSSCEHRMPMLEPSA